MIIKIKYLLFLFFIVSCNMDYFPMPYYDINIPGLENTIKFLNEEKSLIEIEKWVIINIKYKSDIENNGVLEYWATPIETFKKRKGDCEDSAILFAWLCYQYYNIKPKFFWITNRYTNGWHTTTYIEKYNYYFGLKKEKNNKYFKNGALLINWEYNFDEFIILAEYFR